MAREDDATERQSKVAPFGLVCKKLSRRRDHTVLPLVREGGGKDARYYTALLLPIALSLLVQLQLLLLVPPATARKHTTTASAAAAVMLRAVASSTLRCRYHHY
jgi:hypothetical protein